jgi:tRNA-splicing ligase RtcB
LLSRHRAARHTSGRELKEKLESRGILVRGTSWRGLAEEKPEAYKDIEAVVEASDQAGLARRVARLVPLGVVKG